MERKRWQWKRGLTTAREEITSWACCWIHTIISFSKVGAGGKQDFFCQPLLPCWSVVHLSTPACVCLCVCVGRGSSKQYICIQTACPDSQVGRSRRGRKGAGEEANVAFCIFLKEKVGKGDCLFSLGAGGLSNVSREENLITWVMHRLCLHT